MSALYLCGASNPEGVRLALRVNEARARWGSIVLLDDDERRQGEVVLGVPVSGSLSLLGDADPSADEVVNLIARTTRRRFDAALRIATFGVPFASLVHPDVELDEAVLAPGVVVYPRATIGPHVVVGEGSVVFMGAMVGHGSTAGSHCVVAPNAVIKARVTLGDRVYVGTNASVLPDLRIGDDSTVAANSAVMRHVRAGSTVIGVPAKALPAFPAQATPQRPTVRVPAGAS